MKIHKLGRKETYDDLAGLDDEEEEPTKRRKKSKKKERKPKMSAMHKKRGMK